MGESEERHVEAFRKVRELLEPPPRPGTPMELRTRVTVAKWYLGVTLCPSHRWGEEPSPHKHRWDILHVLLLGRDMGRYEKNFLRVLGHIPECKARCANVGAGGERCPRSSIKFLYLCVKYTAPPGGGLLQCLREPLDDGEAELGDSDQAIALYRALEALGRCGPERDRAATRAGSAGAYGIPSETWQLRAARKALGLCRSEREAREWDEASDSEWEWDSDDSEWDSRWDAASDSMDSDDSDLNSEWDEASDSDESWRGITARQLHRKQR